MAKNNHITNSFIAGEASPKSFGRTDVPQYNQALEDSLNVLVHPQGGFSRRPGTSFVQAVVDSDGEQIGSQPARIFPFIGTDGSRWQLIITSFYGDNVTLRWQAVWISGGSTTNSQYLWADFTNAALTWIPAHYSLVESGISRLQMAQSGDVAVFTHPDVTPFQIIYDPNRDVGEQFMFRTYVDFHDALIGKPTTNVTTGVQTSSPNINAFRAMPFLTPVVKTGNSAFGLTMAISAGGVITITATSGSPAFSITSDWVGKVIKFTKLGTTGTVVLIKTVVGTTATGVKIGGATPTNSSTENYGYDDIDAFYEEGAWDKIKGFPRTVTFFENRIVFGGTRTFPDTEWFSQINDIYELDQRGLAQDSGYTDPVIASDPFTTTLRGDDRLCEIRWLKPGKNIATGTNFREFVVQGPADTESISELNIQTNAETAHGSAHTQAIRVESAVIFLHRTRRQLRELVYNFDEDAFKATNLNLIGEHMATKGTLKKDPDYLSEGSGYFTEMAFQEAPYGIIWVLDSSGSLCALTREREQEVVAWQYHEIGGETKTLIGYDPGGDGRAEGFYAGDTLNHRVRSISALQRGEDGDVGEPDDLYMLVLRPINIGAVTTGGATTQNYYEERLYLEVMNQDFEPDDLNDYISGDEQAPVYLDCAYVTDDSAEDALGNAIGIVGPLPHGKGDEVSVILNGIYIGEFTVNASRKIDLGELVDPDVSWGDGTQKIIVGYDYDAYAIPMCPEVPATNGSSQGQPRRIDQIVIHFFRSVGCKFGRAADTFQENTSADEFEELGFEGVEGAAADAPPVRFTGEKKVVFQPGYESRPKIKIQSSKPLPMHVTHVVSRMVVYE
jgi:hypothetical protein